MNIGILGAGKIGATLAGILVKQGHSVAISNSRGPASLSDLIADLGSLAQAATSTEAALFGDIVIEAIPFGRFADLPAEALKGKILVTAANYYPNRDGEIDLMGLTHSQFFTRQLADVKVVKAFNTIFWQHLRDQGDPHKPMTERRVIFIAGDDLEAKATVTQLITELGFAAVDLGSLAESWKQEPGQPIYNNVLTMADAAAWQD
ncbi:MAG: NADPH-dependent F420 reductase [Synechococcaceae cyanobacterium SM2_3_2]|nr:NADPH-dependent F420 reductase [Synechococcaceae cyanobacterium SM2_3_2]